MHFTKITTISFLSTGLISLCWLYCPYAFKKQINKEELIENVMRYDLKPMIERCKREHDYSDEDMVIIEKELKRYFILTELSASSVGMFSRDVDNLWHAFILFTNNYARFCTHCFSHFIHHNPETETVRSQEKRQQSRENFLGFVKLYEETFQEEIHPIWLLDMCEKQMEAPVSA